MRALADGFHVIAGCIDPDFITDFLAEVDAMPEWHAEGEEIHSQFNAYLLSGDDHLLFDTLPPNMREAILTEVEDLLAGAALDYIVISHPEAPHGGNAEALLDQYPNAEVIVPGGGGLHDLHLGGHAIDPTPLEPGETIDLGGRVVECVDPLFYDLAATLWLFDHDTRALFTVDSYGNAHASSECGALLHEIASQPDIHAVSRWLAFHSHTIPWLAYAEPDRINAELEALLDRFEPEMLAPAHGAPATADAATYLRAIRPVVDGISEAGLGQDIRAIEMI